MKELQKVAQDYVHLLIVRKSRKDRCYIIVNGNNNFEFLKNHTKKKFAPCLVAESKASESFSSIVHRFRKRKLPFDLPPNKVDKINAASWSIINSFLKKEPRFKQLPLNQQIRIIWIALRYKKATLLAMRKKVDQLLKK